MKKRIVSALSAVTMLVTGGLALSACKDNAKEQEKVMNVSLNPEIEFVLDSKDKVVSVNALNEEGNVIISGSAEFVGKNADEAVKLFIEISKDTGYMVSGRLESGENEVKVAISGDTKKAQELFSKIQTTVNKTLEDLDIEGTIKKADALTKEYLQNLVNECAPYLDAAKVKAMEYDELVKEIASSRKETKDLLSQELKDAYYQAKADALKLAQLENAKKNLNIVNKAIVDALQSAYETALTNIETARQEIFKEDGVYYTALNNFNSAKVDYLKKRNELSQLPAESVTEEMKALLQTLDTAVENAETALNNAYTTINQTLDNAKQSVNTTYTAVINKLNELNITISKTIDTTSESMTQAIIDFTTKFETDYAQVKEDAKNRVDNMRNSLVAPISV